MPFGKHFQSFVDKAQNALNDHQNRQGGAGAGAPPIPFGSKPAAFASQASPSYWQPTFSASEPVSVHFAHETGQHGWGNNEAQNYVSAPANSFPAPDNSNALIIHAIINNSHAEHAQKYTSARLSSHQTLARDRGCLSARITAPIAKGIWPAFWLLPKDPFSWPTDGEVDIAEAWNGSVVNHSCLHWGHFNGEDSQKHRVVETNVPNLGSREGVRFDFVWDEDVNTGNGRLLWLIDGRPIMKASKPAGTRNMRDFRILINIAVGGNVNQGQMPDDGTYEMVVRDLAMREAPAGGWDKFGQDWSSAPEGHGM